ncbi:hypothetical protein T484DRAFT_1791204, partial [Baffinella frigidus]
MDRLKAEDPCSQNRIRLHVEDQRDDASVKCWGLNTYGQLGQGDTDLLGRVSGDMGNSLPPVPLCLGPCPAGYAEFTGADGGACMACEAGTFKSAVGSGACAACLAGTYTAAPGSGACAACPSNTSSAAGSDELADCACVSGYTAASDGVACNACEAGTYKSAVGSATCETCPANAESSSGSALCQCSAGSVELGGSCMDACPAAGGAVVSPCAVAPTCWGDSGSGQLGRGNTDDMGDEAGEVASLADVDLGAGRTV